MIKKLLNSFYVLIIIFAVGVVTSQFFGAQTFSRIKSSEDFSDQKVIQNPEVTFLAAGDIMLSRNVAASIKKANDPLLPFRSLDGLLKSTDFNFANLESPINGKDTFNPSPSLIFNAPTFALEGLTAYNFKVLNLANNHALDQDLVGLDNTEAYLKQQNIATLGTGDDLDEAWQGKVVTADGFKIGFIGASYASLNDNGSTKNTNIARIEDVAKLKASILNLKSKSDFIVVTMHAGTEYTREPNQDQIEFAHAAIDAGADMVIGAHPHWIQTTEKYQGKYIFYSLGNFVFDQMWSQDTREGLTLKITIDKPAGCHSELDSESKIIDSGYSPAANSGMTDECKASLKQLELIPIVIDNYCCPRLATNEEAVMILNKINLTQRLLK